MTAPAQHSARATATAAATATATATAAVRRPRPDAPAPQRPPLRVVRPNEKIAAGSRRRLRPRLLVAVSVLVGGALLFGLVAAHVLLTQNQFRLQRVQRQAAQEQARYERLRAEVAELESPGRIVAAAQQRLGMVPPASVKYLTPTAGQTAPTAPTATGRAAGSTTGPDDDRDATPRSTAAGTGRAGSDSRPNDHDDADEQAMSDWSEVKRQLSRP